MHVADCSMRMQCAARCECSNHAAILFLCGVNSQRHWHHKWVNYVALINARCHGENDSWAACCWEIKGNQERIPDCSLMPGLVAMVKRQGGALKLGGGGVRNRYLKGQACLLIARFEWLFVLSAWQCKHFIVLVTLPLEHQRLRAQKGWLHRTSGACGETIVLHYSSHASESPLPCAVPDAFLRFPRHFA